MFLGNVKRCVNFCIVVGGWLTAWSCSSAKGEHFAFQNTCLCFQFFFPCDTQWYPSGIKRKKFLKKKSALCFRLSEAFGCGLYWNWVHSQHVEALILVFWMCTLFLDSEKLRH